jgi:hypothetical protein
MKEAVEYSVSFPWCWKVIHCVTGFLERVELFFFSGEMKLSLTHCSWDRFQLPFKTVAVLIG